MPDIEYQDPPGLPDKSDPNLNNTYPPSPKGKPDVTDLKEQLRAIGIVVRPGLMESYNFVAGSAGWQLKADGTITALTGSIGGWNIIAGYLYSLTSGTPTSSPSGGIVIASTNPAITTYEGTDVRTIMGYLSAGVFGFRGYAANGTTTIFELSNTLQQIGGWNFTDTVLRSGASDAASNVLIDSANSLIRLGPTSGNYLTLDGANLRIRTSNYVSGMAGSGSSWDPNLLEVGNIACRGLFRTYVLQKDILSVNAGSLLIAPNADVLDVDMTALDASTMTIKGTATFAVNDRLRIKDTTNDEWFLVTNIASAPTYTVTRDQAAAYGADANPAWKKGASVVNYGQSGAGGLYLTASDTNNPYLSVFTHAGSPWSALTTRLRIGNLNGYLGYVADTFGLGVGSSAGTDANITIDPTNGIRIRQGTTNKITFDNSGNASFVGSVAIGTGGDIHSGQTAYNTGTGWWLEHNGGTPRFSLGVGGSSTNSVTFDGTTLTVNGYVVDGNVYKLLGETTLGADATSISVSSFTAKTNLKIVLSVKGFDVTDYPRVRFNSDSAANYTWRIVTNTGADNATTNAADTSIQMGDTNSDGTTPQYYVLEVQNIATSVKNVIITGNGASTAQIAIVWGAGIWSNTADSITTVTFSAPGGNKFLSGTNVKVFGI